MKSNYIKELFSLIILLALNAFFLYFLILTVSLFSSLASKPNSKFFILLAVAVLIISYVVHRKISHKKANGFYSALAFPFRFIRLIFAVGIPFFMLQLHILLYLGICFAIPAGSIFIYQRLANVETPVALKIFIVLTTAVIICVVGQKQVNYFVQKFPPQSIRNSRKLQPYKIDELSNYLLAESNVRFLVFFIYFFLLVMINAFNLKGMGIYDSVTVDDAVLQSFATFLAFDRIVASLKPLTFQPSEMIRKISASISNKIEDLDDE
jgi:hypothetical protein